MRIGLANLKNDESGIALIIAIILILVMTTLASTISFLSNNDFYSMSNYKRGQEAFLAAESCVIEVRKTLENTNPAVFYELIRSGIDPGAVEVELGRNLFIQKPISPHDSRNDQQGNAADPATWNGPVCRTGSRALSSAEIRKPKNFLITNETKSSRHLKNYSIGHFNLTPMSVIVTGKDSMDKDKSDSNEETAGNPPINTGIEIISGFEVLTLGGKGNEY